MALAAAQSSSADRDELLWEEELARIRAGRHMLTPAAAAAVQSVLSSILHEPDQNKKDLRSILALFQDIRSEKATPSILRRARQLPLGKERPARP